MNDVREMAFSFEALKLGFGQAKDGFTLKLQLHPDNVPKDLLGAPLMTRYMVAMVEIGADESPVAAKGRLEAANAKKSAGMLCENERFQTWVHLAGYADEISKKAAEDAVRTFCGVRSRAEFSTNSEALARFVEMRDAFHKAVRNGEVP